MLGHDEDGRPRHWSVAGCGVGQHADGVRSIRDEITDGRQLRVVNGQHEPPGQRQIGVQTIVDLVTLHVNDGHMRQVL